MKLKCKERKKIKEEEENNPNPYYGREKKKGKKRNGWPAKLFESWKEVRWKSPREEGGCG